MPFRLILEDKNTPSEDYRYYEGKKRKIRLAVTLGDPAGIGPEVTLKSLSDPDVRRMAEIVLVGSLPARLKKSPQLFHAILKYGKSVRLLDPLFGGDAATNSVKEITSPISIDFHEFPVGKPSGICGRSALFAIKKAADMALKKEVDGIVTAPVSKESLALAGCSKDLTGHTEILKKLTRAGRVQMLMSVAPPPTGFGDSAGAYEQPFLHDKKNKGAPGRKKDIRVVLVTRHIPVSKISDGLTASKIISAAADYASVFGKNTRFVVCALNPHAGDGGLLGDEERKIIAPAVRRLKAMGFSVAGPMPADAVFLRMSSCEDFDCALAMYHDQAMIPLKVINPRGIVNVTLGLPFIRTSPGHGVAYDIAAKAGSADGKPMIEAVKFAARYAMVFSS